MRYSTFTFFLHGREWFDFHKGDDRPADADDADDGELKLGPEPSKPDDNTGDEEVKCGG